MRPEHPLRAEGGLRVKIAAVHAQQIIDCKCWPCIEVEIRTESGAVGWGARPTGSSVGMHEAHVRRDGDPAHYKGLRLLKAVANVAQIIGPALIGVDVADQRAVDACGYTGRIGFALDCASSEVFDKATGTCLLKGQRVSADALIAYARGLAHGVRFHFAIARRRLPES